MRTATAHAVHVGMPFSVGDVQMGGPAPEDDA
jgi:hypothetical protein